MGLLFIILILTIIGLPIAISFLIYNWIKVRDFNRNYRLIAFTPILLFCYFIYGGLYPDNDFYKAGFKDVTKMEFPQNGKIIYKIASFPDHFGDYTSSFLVEFDEKYISNLEANLINKCFNIQKNKMSSNELNCIENRISKLKYTAQYSKEIEGGKFYSVGFLNDKKSVIITRISW